MVICWQVLGKRPSVVRVYGAGADVIDYVCTTGTPPPPSAFGGAGAALVVNARPTDLTRIA